MPRPNKEHQQRKDRAMWERYTELSDKKEGGVAKYNHDWIMMKLELEFYLSKHTILTRIKRYALIKDHIPNQGRIDFDEPKEQAA